MRSLFPAIGEIFILVGEEEQEIRIGRNRSAKIFFIDVIF